MNLNYKYTGKHLDYDGETVVAKSTDIVDVYFSKYFFGSVWNLSISNLLNERYERPLTYSKDGRQMRIGFKKNY
jgi:outer membrane receptor protein involved in Fe transport